MQPYHGPPIGSITRKEPAAGTSKDTVEQQVDTEDPDARIVVSDTITTETVFVTVHPIKEAKLEARRRKTPTRNQGSSQGHQLHQKLHRGIHYLRKWNREQTDDMI